MTAPANMTVTMIVLPSTTSAMSRPINPRLCELAIAVHTAPYPARHAPQSPSFRARFAASEIGNMRDLLRRNQQPKYRLIHRNDRVFPPQLFKCRGGVVHGGHAHLIAVVER